MSALFMVRNLFVGNRLKWMALYCALMTGAMLGSLLPDIDHPSSTLGSKMKLLAYIIGAVFGHRGGTHAPLVHTVFFAIFMIIGKVFIPGFAGLVFVQFIIGVACGVISHLILDGLTVAGIPALDPLSPRRLKLARLKTGKHDIVGIVLCIIISISVIAKFSIF